MPASYRPLLPREPESTPNGGAGAGSDPQSSQTRQPRKKHNPAACESCRKRKIRCTGERPACAQCVRRGHASTCKYDTQPSETYGQAFKRKLEAAHETNTVYHDFVDMLRSRPMKEVNDIVARLRTGASAEDLVRQVKSGDLLLQLALSPEKQFRYSIGAMLEIPDFFKTPDNPYMASLVFNKRFDTAHAPELAVVNSGKTAMYDAPFHAAELVSFEIDNSTPSKWTTVSATDEVLRDILRCYFLSVYVFLPFFHMDYFLKDMASGEQDFCSPLLVNSVLAAGCRAYAQLPKRASFWDPSLLQYKFLAEARRLRELESGKTGITRVQADMALHLEYGMNGQDKLGWSLCYQAVTTAQEMGLFSPPTKPMTDAQRIVHAMTSWALFAWQGLQCYHQEKPPLVTVPPDRELPTEPDAFGEIWVKYPTAAAPVPIHFSETFRAMTRFRGIMTEVTKSAYPSFGSTQPIPLAEAIAYRSTLQKWYEELPAQLGPQRLIIPAHFHLHMHYWLVIARLFEPLKALEDDGSSPSEESPNEIADHAKTCIRTLLRLYYSSHGSDGYDLFALLLAQYIGFSALGSIQAPEAALPAPVLEAHEADIIICAQIMLGQSHMAYLSDVVLRVMRSKTPPPLLVRMSRFMTVSDVDEDVLPTITRQVETEWPIHVVAPVGSKDDRRLGNLFRAISIDGEHRSADDSDGRSGS